jgi:hypothetical protein
MIRKGPIKNQGSLVFLDEIQAVPIAVQTLRYFYEDCPELPVIAAGFLSAGESMGKLSRRDIFYVP